MASFSDVLKASEEKLVNLFYRVKPAESQDFLVRINHAAAQLNLNHTQLVCALGFNRHISELTDVLSVVGFSSYKLLTYRRDELFAHGTYEKLSVDNVLDIYAEQADNDAMLPTLRALLGPRLSTIEALIGNSADASNIFSYKMEIHAIYASGIATPEFAMQRVILALARYRSMTDEIQMIVQTGLIPASNLFFSDDLAPVEKKVLLDTGQLSEAMIRNRMQNTAISQAERELLEGYI